MLSYSVRILQVLPAFDFVQFLGTVQALDQEVGVVTAQRYNLTNRSCVGNLEAG